jgi:hypothetical protein
MSDTQTMAKRPQMTIRDDDGELRAMLDDLRVLERPVLTQSDMVRKLAREAWERRKNTK